MEIAIDINLVQRLIAAQFPQWRDLTIAPVAESGWDNRTFHLGRDMLVRLPSSSEHALAVEKEQYWLPKLAPHLPLPVPAPIAIGKPDFDYPCHWSINRWLSTTWQNAPVWVHGDIAPGNLLVFNGQLAAVIDFGQLAVGDPACDMAIAWIFFDDKARKVFRDKLNLDNNTWIRGLAWTLWKALIISAGIVETNAVESKKTFEIIDTVINEYKIYQ